jgi:hypothetical protein
MIQKFSSILALFIVFSSFGYAAGVDKKNSAIDSNSSLKWNKVCEELLDSSVKATIKLEDSVKLPIKMTQKDFDAKVRDEMLVVQLNAWVCAVSTRSQSGIAAEEQFIKIYSKRVQNRIL